MRQDSGHLESSVVLRSGSVAGAGAGQADTTVALPRLAPFGARVSLPRPRVAFGPVAARVALGSLVLAAFAVVLFATAQPSNLVPRSYLSFPHWESGPLHHLFGRLTNDPLALSIGFSSIAALSLVAYGVAVAAVRTLSMRTIVICVVALHAILLMSPPLQLTDLFNYLGYARLGGLHHLNPYTHVMANELHDPAFRFSSWHHLRSPYGPLFTAATYPLALMSIPVAYWTIKVVSVLMSLAFIALVWHCARQLGRDPRFAVLFVAANPVYLFYEVGGFHNDFFMLIPATAAIALLLARRDRAAGAALMVAVAVKFTVILLLPFLLIAARPAARRLRIITGAALATIPLAALSLVLFGLSVPNLQDQSTLLTDFSIPNMVGLAIGIGGGTPALLRVANVALVAAVLYQLRRNRDWLSGAGWSTLALIASLAWLVPWYIVWLLPLAALGTSVRLRRVTAAFTVYLVLAFAPATGLFLFSHGLNPMGSAVGQASKALQAHLEH
jgi:hypothetical protein